jgi:hypothetical protein
LHCIALQLLHDRYTQRNSVQFQLKAWNVVQLVILVSTGLFLYHLHVIVHCLKKLMLQLKNLKKKRKKGGDLMLIMFQRWRKESNRIMDLLFCWCFIFYQFF